MTKIRPNGWTFYVFVVFWILFLQNPDLYYNLTGHLTESMPRVSCMSMERQIPKEIETILLLQAQKGALVTLFLAILHQAKKKQHLQFKYLLMLMVWS